MTRLWMLTAVAAFCVLTAVRPDPRVQAAIDALFDHSHQAETTVNGSFYCPMDPDIRATKAGQCPRCGMTLVTGAPDIVEYQLDLGVAPSVPRAGEVTRLDFRLTDPRDGSPVRRFEIVHEQLYHVFVVSHDLSFFIHTHPERGDNEDFHLDVTLPAAGTYRVLSDFYPSGGTPQLITNTVIVPGDDRMAATPALTADLLPKTTTNAGVELLMPQGHAHARQNARLVFRVSPGDLQTYLGAWGHMLAASADVIDMMHAHPIASADGSGFKDIEFQMVFPRAGVYRTWVQFQRAGIVNTVAFDIPVDEFTE